MDILKFARNYFCSIVLNLLCPIQFGDESSMYQLINKMKITGSVYKVTQ